MANECLVTKLVGASSGDLPMFNKLYFKPGVAGTTTVIFGGATGKPVILSSNGGSVTDNSDNPVTLPSSMQWATTRKLVAADADSEFIVDNKYNLATNFNFPCDLKEIAFCTGITILGDSTALLFGDLVNIKNLVNITNLKFTSNTGITGNLKDLGRLTALKQLEMRYATNIEGNIEDMIAGMIANGRTSASVKADGIKFTSLLGAEKVKFGGAKPSTNGYFVWGAGLNVGEYTITYKKESDDSTISSVTVVVS